jgi:hypothetical protein
MSVTVEHLKRVWQFKLRMGRLSPTAHAFATRLVAELDTLDDGELIDIEEAKDGRPAVSFTLRSTGELLAELAIAASDGGGYDA